MKTYRLKNLIISLLALFLTACASGSAILTGEKRAPIDQSQVKLYLDTPENYEVIGIVNATSDSGWTEKSSQEYAVQELKIQAAGLGANGVLLTEAGEKTSTVVSGYGTGYLFAIPVTVRTLTGKAIFVHGQ